MKTFYHSWIFYFLFLLKFPRFFAILPYIWCYRLKWKRYSPNLTRTLVMIVLRIRKLNVGKTLSTYTILSFYSTVFEPFSMICCDKVRVWIREDNQPSSFSVPWKIWERLKNNLRFTQYEIHAFIWFQN